MKSEIGKKSIITITCPHCGSEHIECVRRDIYFVGSGFCVDKGHLFECQDCYRQSNHIGLVHSRTIKESQTKEMLYQNELLENAEILVKGEHKGITYIVTSRGTHPCCYINVKVKTYLHEVPCHGGVTFEGILDFEDSAEYYIGWDYAHLGDYTGFRPEGRKYTTSEMVNDCKSVIDQLN